MPNQAVACPKCASTEVDYRAKRDDYVCAGCNHIFKITGQAEQLRIFLSYGHDDKAGVAKTIKTMLAAAGHEVWYDEEELPCGKDWEDRIESGLQWVSEFGSRARFVLLMTPHSVRRPSGYCLNELARAQELQISVFPVMLEWVAPPLSVCRFQWLDLRGCGQHGTSSEAFDASIRKLLHALQTNEIDFDGEILRLCRVLDPIPFEATTSLHLRRFTGRQWLADRVDSWIQDPRGDKVMWITGGPGAGKSAFAAWFPGKSQHVKAYFYCKAPSASVPGGVDSGAHGRLVYEPGDPRRCVRTVAFQLACALPDFRRRLNEQDLKRITQEDSAEFMFERLISATLCGVCPPAGEKAVVLVDGLDEVTRDGRNVLAEFLACQVDRTPDWLRFLFTSRYEEPLSTCFQKYQPVSLDAERARSEEDQRLFIARELGRFAPAGHLTDQMTSDLLERSQGSFLYLETLRDDLDRKQITLDDIKNLPRGLSAYYARGFARQFPDVNRYCSELYPKLAMILAADSPLSWEEAECLFGWTAGHQKQAFRRSLGCWFRTVDSHIAPYNQFLADWLADEQRAGSYWVRKSDGHRALADIGLAVYQKGRGALSIGERRCVRELPRHLLALRDGDSLCAFLSDLNVFADWYADDIQSYFTVWNEMCRTFPSLGLLLPDSARRLAQAVSTLRDAGGKSRRNAEVFRAIAHLYLELGAPEQAAWLYEKALTALPEDFDRVITGRLYNETAEALNRVGRLDEAEHYYQKALQLRAALAAETPDLERKLEHGESVNNLGHPASSRGDYEEALPHYREARQVFSRLAGGPFYGEADALNNIAACYDSLGQEQEAEQTFQQCIQILDQLRVVNQDMITYRTNWADFLKRKGRLEEARTQFKRARDLAMLLLGPHHEKTLTVWAKLLDGSFIEKGQEEQALALYNNIETISKNLDAQDGRGAPSIAGSPQRRFGVAVAYNEIAFHFFSKQGAWGRARECFAKAVELVKDLDRPVEVANMRINYLGACHRCGETVDRDEVARLTALLEAAKDRRAGKGTRLLEMIDSKGSPPEAGPDRVSPATDGEPVKSSDNEPPSM